MVGALYGSVEKGGGLAHFGNKYLGLVKVENKYSGLHLLKNK